MFISWPRVVENRWMGHLVLLDIVWRDSCKVNSHSKYIISSHFIPYDASPESDNYSNYQHCVSFWDMCTLYQIWWQIWWRICHQIWWKCCDEFVTIFSEHQICHKLLWQSYVTNMMLNMVTNVLINISQNILMNFGKAGVFGLSSKSLQDDH